MDLVFWVEGPELAGISWPQVALKILSLPGSSGASGGALNMSCYPGTFYLKPQTQGDPQSREPGRFQSWASGPGQGALKGHSPLVTCPSVTCSRAVSSIPRSESPAVGCGRVHTQGDAGPGAWERRWTALPPRGLRCWGGEGDGVGEGAGGVGCPWVRGLLGPREVGVGRLPPRGPQCLGGEGGGVRWSWWGWAVPGHMGSWSHAAGFLGLAPLGCEVGGRHGHIPAGWAPFGFRFCELA